VPRKHGPLQVGMHVDDGEEVDREGSGLTLTAKTGSVRRSRLRGSLRGSSDRPGASTTTRTHSPSTSMPSKNLSLVDFELPSEPVSASIPVTLV